MGLSHHSSWQQRTLVSVQALCASFFHLHRAVPSLIPGRGHVSLPYMRPISFGSFQSVQNIFILEL